MHLDNRTRLLHIADAAREALSFVEGKTRADLESNRMLALALTKCVEIIGEAANGLSEEFRLAHPETPWRAIIANRHRLVHGYYEVDFDRVWETVQKRLEPLLAQVETILEGPV